MTRMSGKIFRATLIAAGLSLAAGTECSLAADTNASDRIEDVLKAAIAHPDDQAAVDAFIKELPEVPAGSGRYIVEGDIAVNRDEIKDYLRSLSSPEAKAAKSIELIVNVGPTGELDYWKIPASRHLSYVVDRASFQSPDQADDVTARMRSAAKDWVDACPDCGVSFDEKSAEEAGPSFSGVRFVVRYENVQGGPIARSFFPSSLPDERELSVFPDYFQPGMSFDKTGVLRHELGHILGYRHEHIGNIPGCNTEGTNWKPLTSYDAKSVMHYFCGGGGSIDLSLRDSDKEGHRCLYLTGRRCPAKQ